MAVPRNRMSNARKNIRRSHHAKKPTNVGVCSNCDEPKLPHLLCRACGQYNGKVVVEVETDDFE